MISLSKFYREDKWGTPNLLLANYYGNRAALRKRLTQENFATYLLFRGDDLAATVAHEESVVDLMDKGMSRVDAEVKVFKQEDADTPKSSLSPEEYCTTGSKAENNMSLSSQQRETAYMNHASCLQSRRRLENSGRDYLHCVQSYKDSNAIEENCRFSP